MRISDWSSDVCSSDLKAGEHELTVLAVGEGGEAVRQACTRIVGDRRSVLEAVLVSRFQRNALAIAADSSSELVGVDCLAKQVGRVEVLAHIGRDNGLAGVVDDSFLHDGAGKLRAKIGRGHV